MFSATVSAGTDVKCWWTIPMPWARLSRGERIMTVFPPIRISPLSAGIIP
jgi:hypothetical protein